MIIIPFDDIASGGSANVYKTIAAVKVDNTTGARIRIRTLNVASSDDNPLDEAIRVQLIRIADVSAGSAGTFATTITAVNLPRTNPNDPDPFALARLNYSAEPTVFDTHPHDQWSFNDRGFLVDRWEQHDDDWPVALTDQLIALRIALSVASTAKVTGKIGFEMF